MNDETPVAPSAWLSIWESRGWLPAEDRGSEW